MLRNYIPTGMAVLARTHFQPKTKSRVVDALSDYWIEIGHKAVASENWNRASSESDGIWLKN